MVTPDIQGAHGYTHLPEALFLQKNGPIIAVTVVQRAEPPVSSYRNPLPVERIGLRKLSDHKLHTPDVKPLHNELAHGRTGERRIGVGQPTLYVKPYLQ